MNESMRQEIALFRYGLIAPLVNGQVDPKTYLKEVAERIHQVPHHGEKRIAAKTILDWCTQYKKGGFEALKPKRRSDRGHSRRLSPEEEDHILALRKKTPPHARDGVLPTPYRAGGNPIHLLFHYIPTFKKIQPRGERNFTDS